jgi:hypothetical protein
MWLRLTVINWPVSEGDSNTSLSCISFINSRLSSNSYAIHIAKIQTESFLLIITKTVMND